MRRKSITNSWCEEVPVHDRTACANHLPHLLMVGSEKAKTSTTVTGSEEAGIYLVAAG